MDIIIPVLNEEEILRERAAYFSELGARGNLIFVDGCSADRTTEVASQYGRVISSTRGRGAQKNLGANHAGSGPLLFLHVDTEVDPEAIDSARRALDNGAAGGCFRLKIDEPGPIFRLFETVVNVRAKCFGVLDGDLGLFLRKEVFEQAGRFDPVPYMEDILFSRRLRQAGPLAVLPDPILVSGRKWRQQGFARTLIQYTFAYGQYGT